MGGQKENLSVLHGRDVRITLFPALIVNISAVNDYFALKVHASVAASAWLM